LEHYTDLVDIKRVLSNTHALKPDFLLEFFGRMTPENCLECMRDLLKYNLQGNIRLVVEVAKKWSDYLTPSALIQLFEEFKSYNGIYFYLGSFVNFTEDKDVVFKFIEAATNLAQMKEVERVCRDNDHYDPKEVKEFLLQSNLKDPRSLIHVCDRFGYVDELTQYLHNHQMFVFIEAYVQRMNSKAAPQVVGTLLDLSHSEEQIKKLLVGVRPPADEKDFVGQLVEQVEKRNRLKILRPWLEERKEEGSEDPHVHNGLAKIYIEANNNPQVFLTSNKFYDSRIVGKFCETRNPHLAFVAYKRANGECDEELIQITNKHSFFKDQARYLVERQSLDLWAKCLSDDNEHKRQLIDQVVAPALPESRVAEEISTAVKAFMAANLPNELIELLERIILHGPADGEFASNRNLQNLLILTAIKADKNRVMDYIKRLDNYDGTNIAQIAISDPYNLYEEALVIYKKCKMGPEAIKVLLENIQDIARATEFAEYWDQPDVWSILAKSQLSQGLVKESMVAFLKADDATEFHAVIAAAKGAGLFEESIEYIQMARGKVKDPFLDNELIFAYAQTERLSDLEEFISATNVAKLQDCGDQCFEQGMYQAAKLLFNHINNNAKLAVCLVKLEQFQEAVDAARKAKSIPTWKEVCFSCVDAKEFRLAGMCGINIIVYMDHLLELCRHYETKAHFDELITLLEQGINVDRAHQGIYTQLGIMYAKYKEEKLMEHVKLFWSRLNIPELIGACQANLHWPETVFLQTHYDQHDTAVDTIINHSAACWKHDLLKEILGKVANTEIYYKAIDFYLREHPLLLNDLLIDMSKNLDPRRVVTRIGKAGHLPLIMKYLLSVQRQNVIEVNEAINAIYVEEENYKGLRQSITDYPEFDQVALAQVTEAHPLVEFRRIAAHLFKINKRWERSIELSKKDEMWADAMQTTAESLDQKEAEKLLTFFVETKRRECFAACLFTCYELIRPDVVLELAWRNKLMNFAMPYMIQCVREFSTKLNSVNTKVDDVKKTSEEKDEEERKAEEQRNAQGFVTPGYNPMMAPLSLPAPPGMMPAMGYPPQNAGFPQPGQQFY
jgi:clathrin heavy chain